MAKFFTIASGSSGNSSFVGSTGEGILVDFGISCRGVTTALKSRGIEPGSLSGILVTHEHMSSDEREKTFTIMMKIALETAVSL